MANKLLILGAAMAHKNKSYNLSESIVPAVDKAVAAFGKFQIANEQRLDKIKQANNLITGKVNDYLSKMDEGQNVNLELVPDPIRKAYYGALNGAKNELGKLLIEQNGTNSHLYAPGTDGYIEMQDKINSQRKKVDRLYKNATKFQQINANWFNEHGNISEVWKTMNPELYAAMSNILNTENPNYTIELDDAGDWTISTDIDTTDYSQITADDSPGTLPKSSKNIKVELDDLDWAQISFPEIKKINDVLNVGITKGQNNQLLTRIDVNEMRGGFSEMIGNDEDKLYSLMFDELPIGTLGGKMSLFTDDQFAIDYPDFDPEDPSTYPDFKEMKDKTIERLVKMAIDENLREREKSSELDTDQEDFFNMAARFKYGIKNLGTKPNKKQIIDWIVNSSPFKGEINEAEGDNLIPKASSGTQSVFQEFSIGEQIDKYIAGGYTNPNEIILAIIEETRSTRDAQKSYRFLKNYDNLTQQQQAEYYAGNL